MRVWLSILVVLLFGPGWSGDKRLPLFGTGFETGAAIRSEAVRLAPGDPSIRRIGRLTWLGGVRLSSADPAFGGFSALSLERGRFTLLGDGGGVVRFSLDRTGRVSGASFADLREGPGTGWRKRDRDSESLVIDARTGTSWIGFEYHNAIWRYRDGRATGHAEPPAMRRWSDNGGPEAMAALPGGGMIVLAEDDPWRGGKGRAGIRFTRDPVDAPTRGFRFSYLPSRGYSPVDAALTPDGMLLVLERRATIPGGFASKLMLVNPATIVPGAEVQGHYVATLAPPLIHDNFEGVAVTHEGSATIVWLVSDDNQSSLQRTLLLKFRLEPERQFMPRRR